MRVAFRVDASIDIGSGHVMRCLTLADALVSEGAECSFICREHPGHLIEFIRAKGYPCYPLGINADSQDIDLAKDMTSNLSHAGWLGVTWQQDAQQTATVLCEISPDWLVVDHYALDDAWERTLQRYYLKLLVIDDLADRPHTLATLLLDQTFGRDASDYVGLVSPSTSVLVGAKYALLRPEFVAWRERSLQRRAKPGLAHILVNLGGVDKDNVTGQVLSALEVTDLPVNCRITVVMGAGAPNLSAVKAQAFSSKLPIELVVGANNMAELMTYADLAIGAAGSTAWERCCLGLPTMMIVLAPNQRKVADGLYTIGAADVISLEEILSHLPAKLEKMSVSRLQSFTRKAKSVCYGEGVSILVERMR